VRLPPIPELTRPFPLGAVALLALNDHWLKRAWPGLVTGKLSDLCGCFVLPLFVSALLACLTRWPLARRLAAGAAVTVVFFAALKVSPAVADAVAHALDLSWTGLTGLRSRIVADPSDLVALPCALLAVAWGRRAGRAAVAASASTEVTA
jgi:hypothetical protein